MNKRFFLLIIISALSFPSFSQTLFTYGPYAVQADEFVKAYNKNNTAPAVNKEKAMRDYLNLYINSRLKIREALERRYDTLPQITVEVTNLRNQIIENFMSDPQTMTKLTQEAFARSQKDIHVAHIFIAANNNDTAAAFNQSNSIYERLQKEKILLHWHNSFHRTLLLKPIKVTLDGSLPSLYLMVLKMLCMQLHPVSTVLLPVQKPATISSKISLKEKRWVK